MTDRELLQMAFDALNNFDKGNHGMRWQVPVIKALRARLAQPEQEPCIHVNNPKGCYRVRCQLGNKCVNDDMSFRTTPPQRESVYCGCGDEIVAGDGARCGTCVAVKYKEKEWQGLTDEEIENCFEMSMFGTCRAIEAKLREKNG